MKTQHWTEDTLVAFDCESTGTDPKTARILQAAFVTLDPEGILKEANHVLYINPGIPIPAEASAIHGITVEKLADEHAWDSATGIPYLFGIVSGRASFRGYPLVIYNACYDWPLLMAECARIQGFDYLGQPKPLFLDPLVIDRALDKYRKGSRKLEDVAKFYGVPLMGAHGAEADATATLGVMRALIKVYPQLKTFDLTTMQKLQAGWYVEWRDHINEYWAKSGKTDRIVGEWPGGL